MFSFSIMKNGTICITGLTPSLFSPPEVVIPTMLDGRKVESIGNSAFSHSDITRVIIPESIKHIGNQAFWGCDELVEVNLPQSLLHLGTGAFSYCNKLSTISLPDGISILPDELFMGCINLNTVDLPHSLKRIGHSAFSSCKALSSILLPSSLNGIGSEAFSRCDHLTSIVIPDSVTKIGERAFLWCTKLSKILISPDNPSFATIDGVVFEKRSKKLLWFSPVAEQEEYQIPFGIQSVAASAFSHTQCKRVYCPSTLQEIGDEAFQGSEIEELTIDASIKYLGSALFAFNHTLRKISIIGDCDRYYIDNDMLIDSETNSVITCCNKQLIKMTIPPGIEMLDEFACSHCYFVETVILPDTLEDIEEGVFNYCKSLRQIQLPASIQTIGAFAFAGCEKLTSLILPDDIKEIPTAAFWGCKSLHHIYLPSCVERINCLAFSDCPSLLSLEIPQSVNDIDEKAFEGRSEQLIFTVEHNSYALSYATANSISYNYPDSFDWLL